MPEGDNLIKKFMRVAEKADKSNLIYKKRLKKIEKITSLEGIADKRKADKAARLLAIVIEYEMQRYPSLYKREDYQKRNARFWKVINEQQQHK